MLMLPVATIHHILKGHHNYRQSLKKLYYHPQHSVAGVLRIKTPISGSIQNLSINCKKCAVKASY